MAKKKKKEEEVALRPNQVSDALAYQGSVKIQYCKGKKVFKTVVTHNKGTSELFRYMANCLIGNINNTTMPRYIHTFYCTPEQIQTALQQPEQRSLLWSNSTCSFNVPFNSVQARRGTKGSQDAEIETPYISEYTFMLPYTQLHSTSNVICLYNTTSFNTATTPLAYIILTGDDVINISAGNTNNVVITWSLSILNPSQA